MKTLASILAFCLAASVTFASDPIPRLASEQNRLLNQKRALQAQIASARSSLQTVQSQHDALLLTNQQLRKLYAEKSLLRSDLLEKFNLASHLR